MITVLTILGIILFELVYIALFLLLLEKYFHSFARVVMMLFWLYVSIAVINSLEVFNWIT